MRKGTIVNIFIILLLYLFPSNAFTQVPIWKINAPQKDSIISNENLFISISFNNLSLDKSAIILLDNKLITGNIKIAGGNLTFLTFGTISDGQHQITIKYFVPSLNKTDEVKWVFYVNNKNQRKSSSDLSKNNTVKIAQSKDWVLTGNVLMDYRTEYLNGIYADSFRQEPSATRAISVDMKLKHKSLEIPIKFFNTSDNVTSFYQPRNYFQIGLHYKNFEIDYGDMNPSLDQLIVSGIRVNGFHLKLKLGNNSLQTYYGNMVQNSIEGSVNIYTPGSGYIPPTLYFDNKDSSLKYITPGVYKRWMAAGRYEFRQKRKDCFAFGITGFKATDVVKSIHYGFQPKDNIVGGLDFSVKLFKKTVILSGEIAASAITNDISYGVLNTAKLDSAFNTEIAFNANDYYPYFTINSSTLPGRLNNANEALAITSKLIFNKNNNSFNVEYKSYGPSFYSLGNPYLRNNYTGISVGDRIRLWKNKFMVNVNYQHYTNNLNNTLPMLVATNAFNGSFTINISPKVPTIFFNYLQQQRNGESNLKTSISSVNDFVYYYLTSINYPFKFLQHEHGLRANFTVNERKDEINIQSRSLMYNYMIGYNTSINKFTVSIDGGQTIIQDYQDNKIANIFSYAAIIDWKIIPKKLFTGFSISNNRNLASTLSPSSSRMSYIYKIGYRFAQGMGLDAEGGYTPYTDYNTAINNFDEKYVYIRYTYDFNLHLF